MNRSATSKRLERIISRYGEMLTCTEVAEVLKYSSAAAVRQAHAAGNLPVNLFRMPGRRPLFADAVDVARAIDTLVQDSG